MSNHNLSKEESHSINSSTFSLLFEFENLLRFVTYIILKAHFGKSWMEINIKSDDQNSVTLSKAFNSRKSWNKKYEYIGISSENPMLFLTSGELVRIITAENIWPLFKHLFTSSKEIVKTKLGEAIAVRNNFAHFRSVNGSDNRILRQSIEVLCKTMESYVEDIYQSKNHFKSNNDYRFYKLLKTISGKLYTFKFTRSDQSDYLRLKINIDQPAVHIGNPHMGDFSCVLPYLSVERLFEVYPDVRDFMVFCEETIMGNSTGEKLGSKTILNILMNTKYLENNIDRFVLILNEVQEQYKKEVEEIKVDKDYRGVLVNAYIGLMQEDYYLSSVMSQEVGYQTLAPAKMTNTNRKLINQYIELCIPTDNSRSIIKEGLSELPWICLEV